MRARPSAVPISGKQEIELAALGRLGERNADIDVLKAVVGTWKPPPGDMIASALHEKPEMNLARHEVSTSLR